MRRAVRSEPSGLFLVPDMAVRWRLPRGGRDHNRNRGRCCSLSPDINFRVETAGLLTTWKSTARRPGKHSEQANVSMVVKPSAKRKSCLTYSTLWRRPLKNPVATSPMALQGCRNEAFKLVIVERTDTGRLKIAIHEQYQGRQASHTEFLGRLRIVVSIDEKAFQL